MARRHIKSLLSLVPPEKKEEALFCVANIFLKGNQANPRPANGTMKVRALEAAFAEHKELSFRTKPVVGYNGRTFNVVDIQVENYVPPVQETEEDSDEE
jgi:hypothetical protein